MSKFIDITGKKYNSLLVVERLENTPAGVTRWKCICDCGNYTVVRGGNIKNGSVKSCGCLRKNYIPKNKTHGMSNSQLYNIWNGMKSRCYNKNSKSYKDYGERGICVCDEWRENSDNFMNWAMKNGYKEGLTIDRIDINQDYCPQNCRWISKGEQAKNRRMNYEIEYHGEIKTLKELCDDLDLEYKRIHNRITKLGWSVDEAINTPVNKLKRNMEARKKYGDN